MRKNSLQQSSIIHSFVNGFEQIGHIDKNILQTRHIGRQEYIYKQDRQEYIDKQMLQELLKTFIAQNIHLGIKNYFYLKHTYIIYMCAKCLI